MFPSGLPGCALLLMRVSLASFLFLVAWADPCPLALWMRAGLALFGVALLAGAQTPLVAGVYVLVALPIGSCFSGMVQTLVVLHALNAAALAMLGPGAYSIDRKLYGRRELDLEN